MSVKELSLPTVELIAGTRVALGVGIGLLLADHLTPKQRRTAGLMLLAVGALTTIPLAATVYGAPTHEDSDGLRVQSNSISPYVTSAREGGLR